MIRHEIIQCSVCGTDYRARTEVTDETVDDESSEEEVWIPHCPACTKQAVDDLRSRIEQQANEWATKMVKTRRSPATPRDGDSRRAVDRRQARRTVAP